MPITAVLGEQRGDEGKGRFVDMLMPEHDIGARFNGGDNAGHTVVDPEGNVFKLHGMPSSIVHEDKMSVIGNGVVINASNLNKEIEYLKEKGVEVSERCLLISGSAHLILPQHISRDEIRESGKSAQGSTKSGIAQAYGAKHERIGVRAEIIKNNPDELEDIIINGLHNQREQREYLGLERINEVDAAKEYVEKAKNLGSFLTDTARYLNGELGKGKKVLTEGAQAFLLDIDHGMYPYVSSSSSSVGGVMTGLGVAPGHIERTIGVVKAVPSHVGGGPFVSEINDEDRLKRLRGNVDEVDGEYGTTTGRPRRIGYLDIPQIKRAQMVNGTTEMALTKLDKVSKYGKLALICVEYERTKANGMKSRLAMAPDAAYKLDQCKPIFHPLETWRKDISDVRKFEDLPENAQAYVKFIEAHTEVPIKMIGVGPGRDQVIVR